MLSPSATTLTDTSQTQYIESQIQYIEQTAEINFTGIHKL